MPLRGRRAARALAQHVRSLPGPVAIALAVAFVAAPAAAATATALRLEGTNGAQVAVTRTGAVPTAAVAPTSLRAFRALALGGGECQSIYTVPAGYAFVLEQVTVNVFDAPQQGPGLNVRLAVSSSCTNEFGDVNPQTVGATTLTLTPALVLPPGQKVWVSSDNGVLSEVYGYGYLEPKADMPATVDLSQGSVVRTGSRNNENTIGSGATTPRGARGEGKDPS